MEKMNNKTCGNCWNCSPGTPWKGYCHKWDISTEYSGGPCIRWKEASEERKTDLENMQNWLTNNGYKEVKDEQ